MDYNEDMFVGGLFAARSAFLGSGTGPFDAAVVDYLHEYRGMCDFASKITIDEGIFGSLLDSNLADAREIKGGLLRGQIGVAYDAGISACISVAEIYPIPRDVRRVRSLRESYLGRVERSRA